MRPNRFDSHLHQLSFASVLNIVMLSHVVFCSLIKIIALNKTKERMRPYHVYQEEEDPDIKKIKKVKNFNITWPEICVHTYVYRCHMGLLNI